MVCPRCIDSVGEILKQLNLTPISIKLGAIILNEELTDNNKKQLKKLLENQGFELLENKNEAIINQIKSLVIQQIHHKTKRLRTNFSTFISDELNQDYSSLSRLFSKEEGITIEKYIVKQKVEKIKEFIRYNELSFSEIAFEMGYSSSAHLSAQFKKETGYTPSEFRRIETLQRTSLDKI